MATYKTIAGFVQFEPNEREASGQTVRDVVIAPVGAAIDANVRITIWPEFSHVPLKKGDWVSAQGKFTTSTVSGKTYYNLSATDLLVTEAATKKERGVADEVQEDEETTTKAPF